jgi:hypothetical protein
MGVCWSQDPGIGFNKPAVFSSVILSNKLDNTQINLTETNGFVAYNGHPYMYPVFRIPMDGKWSEVLLKANTNNFLDNHLYWYFTFGTNWPTYWNAPNADTNAYLYYVNAITNAAICPNEVIIIPSRTTRGNGNSSWMTPYNQSLIWVYRRATPNITENTWNPIVPIIWVSSQNMINGVINTNPINKVLAWVQSDNKRTLSEQMGTLALTYSDIAGFATNSQISNIASNLVGGTVLLANLPTNNPHVINQLWRQATNIYISTGP